MTTLMITIDGGTLSYNVSGAGPPIVFVAGLGEHGTYWMAQVAAFSSAFQVVTFDHGGVGASEGEPPYTVEQWASDTLHRSPGSRPRASGRTFDRRCHCTSARSRSFRPCRVPRTRCNLGPAGALYEQVGFDRRCASRNTPQEIAAARIDALLAYDAGGRLRSIRNPTLLIAAADDLLVPWQLSELIAQEIAHARLVKLDHGGHHFPRTQVEAYNTLLLEFFRAHAERETPSAGLRKSAVLNPTLIA